jgi:predicted secreted protein
MKLTSFIILSLSIIIGFGSVFAACSCRQTEMTGTMDISEPANPISVSSGENFTIILESNPTTGYSWHLDRNLDGSIVKFSGSKYVLPESNLDGAPGKEVLMFTAVNRGTTTISMHYSRSWEKIEQPAKTAIFTVIVK